MHCIILNDVALLLEALYLTRRLKDGEKVWAPFVSCLIQNDSEVFHDNGSVPPLWAVKNNLNYGTKWQCNSILASGVFIVWKGNAKFKAEERNKRKHFSLITGRRGEERSILLKLKAMESC
jgi:hypothetical protein